MLIFGAEINSNSGRPLTCPRSHVSPFTAPPHAQSSNEKKNILKLECWRAERFERREKNHDASFIHGLEYLSVNYLNCILHWQLETSIELKPPTRQRSTNQQSQHTQRVCQSQELNHTEPAKRHESTRKLLDLGGHRSRLPQACKSTIKSRV